LGDMRLSRIGYELSVILHVFAAGDVEGQDDFWVIAIHSGFSLAGSQTGNRSLLQRARRSE
jgi:MFS-type transporter involved in bile tolerance (Atg22 family)